MAGLRYASRDSCDFALESEHIWRDRELLLAEEELSERAEFAIHNLLNVVEAPAIPGEFSAS